MASTNLDLGEELGGLVAKLGQPVEQAAREMIVLELYRRSLISSGKAAELLGVPRVHFIQRAGKRKLDWLSTSRAPWKNSTQATQTRMTELLSSMFIPPVKAAASKTLM
jgi:hypothetical protein